MTVPQAGSEIIGLASVLAEVRRRASNRVAHIFDYERRDPLEALRRQIRSAPHTAQNLALVRILEGFAQEYQNITCRSDDVAALGPDALALLSALIEEFMNGRYTATNIREALFI